MNKIILILFLLILYLFCSNNKEKFTIKKNHHHHHNMHKHMHNKKNKKTKKNICRGRLTDLEYLDHMIPHHQVAIDISIKLQNITRSPIMHEIYVQRRFWF